MNLSNSVYSHTYLSEGIGKLELNLLKSKAYVDFSVPLFHVTNIQNLHTT